VEEPLSSTQSEPRGGARVPRAALAAALALACLAAYLARPRGSPPDASREPGARELPRPSDSERVAEGLRAAGLVASPPSGPAAGEADLARRHDVLLIVLDTLRRDRVGAYGRPDTTPSLDRWALEATVFTRARSVAPWTVPAHASLFTGRTVARHGAHGGSFESGVDYYALSAGTPTLAARLRDAGYATFGIAANRGYLNEASGLAQGFDAWICEGLRRASDAPLYADAGRVTDMALEVLRAPRERPLFLFLNYIDVHAPFVLREEYLAHPERVDRELLPGTPEFERQSLALMAEGEPLTPEVVATWSEAYDAALRYLDHELGRLLDRLPELGFGADDWVVVLSDHGEFFGEHELVFHSKGLYDEVLAIPLLVRAPGFAPGRDDRPVQTHDVPRWILDGLGLARLPEMAETGALQVSELYYSRPKELRVPALRARFNRIQRAFVRGNEKLLLGEDGARELYDLAADPGEARPLSAAGWAQDLELLAREWLSRNSVTQGEAAPIDADTAEALRALGYAGEADAPAEDP
jgi:arylsulfatase A-like enzyme